MKELNLGGIPTSMGESINLKYHLDLVKHQYDRISLGYYKQLFEGGLHTDTADWPERKQLWDKFLHDLGTLFFGQPPYVLDPDPKIWGGDSEQILIGRLGMAPQKINLVNILCKGTPLNLGEEYIVITTKCRQINRKHFYQRSLRLWRLLTRLSQKYKIVVLGERDVQMRKEYDPSMVFGIYEHIISNVPADRLVDLTVPALGETVSSLAQVQQDCLIMNGAKFVITIGLGGNSCMAHSCSKMAIGYRADTLPYADKLFSRDYPDMIITKDWQRFLNLLEGYL
jgi:hypothetical protein